MDDFIILSGKLDTLRLIGWNFEIGEGANLRNNLTRRDSFGIYMATSGGLTRSEGIS